jgi:hypothetical protein
MGSPDLRKLFSYLGRRLSILLAGRFAGSFFFEITLPQAIRMPPYDQIPSIDERRSGDASQGAFHLRGDASR